jgi:hypothetical protein
MIVRQLVVIALMLVVLVLAACGGQSQDYINGYKQGYSLGSSLTAGGEAEANNICYPNTVGADKQYADGYMAGCTDAATGQHDRYP